jgi:hypothetical protein
MLSNPDAALAVRFVTGRDEFAGNLCIGFWHEQ